MSQSGGLTSWDRDARWWLTTLQSMSYGMGEKRRLAARDLTGIGGERLQALAARARELWPESEVFQGLE